MNKRKALDFALKNKVDAQRRWKRIELGLIV